MTLYFTDFKNFHSPYLPLHLSHSMTFHRVNWRDIFYSLLIIVSLCLQFFCHLVINGISIFVQFAEIRRASSIYFHQEHQIYFRMEIWLPQFLASATYSAATMIICIHINQMTTKEFIFDWDRVHSEIFHFQLSKQIRNHIVRGRIIRRR